MAKTAGSSWVRAPILLHSECPSSAKVNHYSNLKRIDDINKKLTMQQKIMFQDSCFGQFLKLETSKLLFVGQVIHQLLVKEVESPNPDEMWFLVGGKTIRFSMQEFCIVTGLNCSPCSKIDVRNVEGTRLADVFFDGNLNLKVSDIEAAFLNGSANDETMVKLAMLFFLELVLLGRRSTASVHNNQYILLIDDFQQFQNYSWGRVCYQMTIENLKKVTPSSTYTLKGFPYAFQIWAFEAIPSLTAQFAFKRSSQLPRMCNWSCNGTPKSVEVVDVLEKNDLQVYTVLKPSDKEKQREYLHPFISPASSEGSSTYSQEVIPQIDRHLFGEPRIGANDLEMMRKLEVEAALERESCLAPEMLKARHVDGDSCSLAYKIEEPKVGMNDVGVKRKYETEAALEEELCLVPRKLKARFGDSEPLSSEQHAAPGLDSKQLSTGTPLEVSHSALPAPVENNIVDSHSSLPAPVETNEVDSSNMIQTTSPVDELELAAEEANQVYSFEEQKDDVQRTQPPVFWLREDHAIFQRIKTMLEKSPQDFLASPQSINQAKHLLQPFYSMKFEQLANQSEQLESSIELLLEAGHFPPHMLDTVKSFHKKIARDIERHSSNCERINKFDKNKREIEVHWEELSKMKSHFDHIAKKIASETQKLEQVSKSMSCKEAEVNHLAKSAKASADAFSRNVPRLKTLEEEKQEAEKEKDKILNRWDEFKRVFREYL